MPFIKHLTIILITVTLAFVGCKQKTNKTANADTSPNKELIVYCENSMLGLVLELKEEFENQYKCSIRIQNDCAQNLMDLISYTGKGDLYIPSSTATFDNFYNETGQALMDSVFIGYNNLVFMVKKGNPKQFDGQLSSLVQKDKHSIIIANPETSSIGYETRKILTEQKIYDRLLQNVVALTSDSKGLIKGLKNDQADVVIDWESNLYVNGNSNHVDIISPKMKNIHHFPTYATSLSCSTEPALTKAFLTFTANQLNETRLSKYGFTKRRTIIF